jgi:hypothetical protein
MLSLYQIYVDAKLSRAHTRLRRLSHLSRTRLFVSLPSIFQQQSAYTERPAGLRPVIAESEYFPDPPQILSRLLSPAEVPGRIYLQ